MTENKTENNDLGITVKKEQDPNEWYSQVVLKSGIADYAPVKGCMIIKPYGYKIWELIQDYLNKVFEKYNVKNAYFPIFIPESFFKKESEHAQGFNPEVAWIERKDETEERLAIRPTSETIMYYSFAKWIRSWRDLPFKINQWCNIVRWETNAVKLLLRSREFLWQEGHCVYETEEECINEAKAYLKEYETMSNNLLCIPSVLGKKTNKEKFAGATTTYCFETILPDGKAIQLGTTHNLGTNFAKAFNIQFLGKDSKLHYPYQNSWAVSTRLIGSVIIMHGDNKGLVLPPEIAPIQIIIVPVYHSKNKQKVLRKCQELKETLKEYRIEIDDRDYRPGWKFNDSELKGIPLRIEIGEKETQSNKLSVFRRDTLTKKIIEPKNNQELKQTIKKIITEIQENLFQRAKKHLEDHTIITEDYQTMINKIKENNWALVPFCGDEECETKIKEETAGINSRVIPFHQPETKGQKCIRCGKQATFWCYFARSY